MISIQKIFLRIGKSFRKTIIEKIDSEGSIQFCDKVFSSWDYRLKVKSQKEEFFIKHTKSSYLSTFKRKIDDINYNSKMKNLKAFQKFFLVFKRTMTIIFTLILLVGSGVGFVFITNESFDVI